MKRFVVGAAALVAAGWTASAEAADLNYGQRAPYTVNQPLNAYSWAGPYLGANLGYEWGSVSSNPAKPSGFVGGAQAGYNFQNGPWAGRSRTPPRAGPPASARKSASRRTGAPSSNISTSICRRVSSRLQACQTATAPALCAQA